MLENFLQVVFLDTHSVVLDREAQVVVGVPRLDEEVDGLVGLPVFDGVVDKVEDDIGEMHLVDIALRVYRLDIGDDFATGVLHAQREGVGHVLYHLVEVELLFLEDGVFLVEHRHLEHFLHEEPQSFRLILDGASDMLHHGRALGERVVVEHLCRQRYAGDRRLEFVRHVVDEIVLDFGVPFLSEHHDDGEDERDEQDDGEDNGWNHEPDAREDILVHLREVYLHHTRHIVRVVAVELLLIGVFLPILVIVGTSVDLPAILGTDSEVVGQSYAIVLQFSLQVVVEQLEVHSLIPRFL